MSVPKIKKLIECKSALIIGEKGAGKTSICASYSTIDLENRKSVYFTSGNKETIINKIKAKSGVEVIESIKKIDEKFEDWMVTYNYEVEKKQ